MPTLDKKTKFKVRVRVALTAGLDAMPVAAMTSLRNRHVKQPTALTAAATKIMRHRNISPVESFTMPNPPHLVFAARENLILRRVYWFGEAGHEPEETELWREACSHATRIVEIGANIGYFTVHGAHAAPDAAYTAIEANPEAAAIVQLNLSLNNITNVTLINAAAVGDPDVTSLELSLPDEEQYAAPTGSFLRSHSEGIDHRRPSRVSVTVPAVYAPSVIDGCDLLKLDIEGSEHSVLEDALPGIIERGTMIFVEMVNDTPSLRKQVLRLLAAGFEAWAITPRGLVDVANADLMTIDLPLTHSTRDLVIGPPDRIAALRDPA